MAFDLGVFGTVFGVIFVAELPDKTAVAALLLATKYRPGPVFLGAALALTVQSVVAVAAGGMLSLLPARPVHIGAGVVMLVSAVVMWRRKNPEAAEAKAIQAETRPPTLLRAFIATFSLIFVAEWGDLTQLGTAALAARYRSPLTVFAAATLALWAVAALAILVGNRARALMNPELTKRIAAVVFLVLGGALVAGLV
jgi:putative Ca2+/H+ antiporter (TMEM165/GDT1 family)